ncbi:hypothetical protein MRX96_055420 [Rhipicephalus microplus]
MAEDSPPSLGYASRTPVAFSGSHIVAQAFGECRTPSLNSADMNIKSAPKRSRPIESGSNDEGALRKNQAVETERLNGAPPTTPSSDALSDEHSVTGDTDGTNESEY